MTSRNEPASVEGVLGNHEERIRALERVHHADATWPTMHLIIPWLDNDSALWSDYNQVEDLAGTLTGSYAEATADDDRFTWPVRLGPLGSRWSLFVYAHRNTDHGKVDYEFATASDDFYGPGRFNLDADANFFTLQTRDMYNPVPTMNENFTESVFEIDGADGQELTSISGTVPRIFDGGSGLYLFRLHTNGQNVSSSGFKSQIIALILRRQPG